MLIAIEILSVCFNLLYLFYAIKQKSIAWIFGTIASILSFYLFYKINFNGSAALNIIYAFQGIFGFMQWQFFNKNRQASFYITLQQHLLLIGSVIIGFLILNSLFGGYFPERLQKIDLLLALGCILTTFLEIRKETSCWYYWIVLNCAFTVLYSLQHIYLYAALMLALAVFSVYALKEWKKVSFVNS